MSSDGEGTDGKGEPRRAPGREPSKPLPKRFYKTVSIAAADAQGHAILLDGRTARTPGRRPLALSTRQLAEAVASEWDAIATVIDPARMALTRLANTAIDGVRDRMTDVAADVVAYACNDLVCYRADFPDGLAERQRALWDPVVAWANERLAVNLTLTTGVMPIAQLPQTADRIAAAIAPLEAFGLTSLHVMTTLMGSAILALAVIEAEMPAETAWAAAHVDEDWQIASWGADPEAAERRARRWQEMRSAATMAALARL